MRVIFINVGFFKIPDRDRFFTPVCEHGTVPHREQSPLSSVAVCVTHVDLLITRVIHSFT